MHWPCQHLAQCWVTATAQPRVLGSPCLLGGPATSCQGAEDLEIFWQPHWEEEENDCWALLGHRVLQDSIMLPCLPWVLQMLAASHQLGALNTPCGTSSPGSSLPVALGRCQGDEGLDPEKRWGDGQAGRGSATR